MVWLIIQCWGALPSLVEFLWQYHLSIHVVFYSSIGTGFSRTEPMKWMEVGHYADCVNIRLLLTWVRRRFRQSVPDCSKSFIFIWLHRSWPSRDILVSFPSFDSILRRSERSTGHLWPRWPACQLVRCRRWYSFYSLNLSKIDSHFVLESTLIVLSDW